MMRVPEALRERILKRIGEGASYRDIQKEFRVGSGTVAQIKREANLSVHPSAPQVRPEAQAKDEKTGGDGLSEFQPKQEKKQAPEALPSAPGSEPAGGSAARDEVYQCARCGARWQLEADEPQVKACPGCRAVFA